MSYIINETQLMSSIPKNVKRISEGRVRLEVCLQTANDINRNKRRYSRGILESGINKIQPRIYEGSLLGELDHPVDNNPVRQCTVWYKEASHQIKELGWDGNKLIGVLETVRTPNGKILKNFAEDKVPVGFSFRGMGDLRQVTEHGKTFYDVREPLHVITWDAVSYPSHAEATLIKVTEGVVSKLNKNVDVITESNGIIHTAEGTCYIPNDFDNLVERRIVDLKGRFSVYNARRLRDKE